MAINQTSNNQLQADLMSQYTIQQRQRDIQPQQQALQKTNDNNDASSSGVKVSISSQNRTAAAGRTENNARVEAEQKPQASNAQTQRAMEAYQQASRVNTENTKPENARQKQINRIAG